MRSSGAGRLQSILRRRAPLALATCVACVAITAVAAAIAPARYTARVSVLVDAASASAPAGGPMAGRDASLATQVDVVTSGRVALKALDTLRPYEPGRSLGGGLPAAGAVTRHELADRLLERLTVRAAPSSGVLEIAYTADDPGTAVRTADAFARAYVDTLAEIRADATRRALQEGLDPRATRRVGWDATVLDVARPPSSPDGPGAGRAALLALPLGLLAALLAVVVAEVRRPRVHTCADLARLVPEAQADTLSASVGARSPPLPARASSPPAGVETGIFAPPLDRSPPRSEGPARGGAGPADRGGVGHEPSRTDRAGAEATAVHTEPEVSATAAARTSAAAGSAGSADAGVATPSARAIPTPPLSLGRLLVQSGLVHPPEVERTLAWARQEGLRLGEAAVARRLVTSEQVERLLAAQFDYPMLQAGRSAVRPQVVAAYDVRSPIAADLRRLRARLDGTVLAPGARRCIAVAGVGPACGRSFVAANLAVCIAQTGRRTLLIDADLRDGRLHTLFGLHDRSGLASMLNRRVEPGALQPVGGLPTLTLLASGPRPPNPAELLSRDAFGQLLASFLRAFDAVVLDSGVAEDEPDARLVARAAGAVVLVVRRGAVTREQLTARVRELRDDRAAVSATLLNLH
jgi:capsular exopolysaccharide synthesis family protein